jgi:hypothetical protein
VQSNAIYFGLSYSFFRFLWQAQLILIQSHPSYLKKCVQGLKRASWEPSMSDDFIEYIEHLSFLLKESKLDHSISSRAVLLMRDSSSNSLNVFRALCLSSISGMLPAGFGKKELTKLITHNNVSLRLLGTEFLQTLLNRVDNLFSSVLLVDRLTTETIVVETLNDFVPDFLTLYNARTVHFADLTALSVSLPSDSNVASPPVEKDLDIEMNFGDGNDSEQLQMVQSVVSKKQSKPSISAIEMTKSRQLIVLSGLKSFFLCLTTWSRLAEIFVAKSKCDFLKFVDELSTISLGTDDKEFLYLMHEQTLEALFSLLDFAGERGLVSWFGTEDDAIKLLNAILVNEDWRAVCKTTPLSYVLSLGMFKGDSSLKSFSTEFKNKLLLRSCLFGPGLVDNMELAHEATLWIESCSSIMSISLLDVILRLSFHLSPHIGRFFDSFEQINISSTLSFPLQLALLLVTGNLLPIGEILPKFMQVYISGLCNGDESVKSTEQCVGFFEKFNRNFRFDLEITVKQVLSLKLATSCCIATTSENFLVVLKQLKTVFQDCDVCDSFIEVLSVSRYELQTLPKQKKAVTDKKRTVVHQGQDGLIPVPDNVNNFAAMIRTSFLHCKVVTSAILKSIPSPKFIEDFLNKFWKFYSIRALLGQNLSDIPSELLSWVDIRITLMISADPIPSPINVMFFLTILQQLNRFLLKSIKSESDMEKRKCANCLVLADNLISAVTKQLNALKIPEFEESLLNCPMILDSLMADHSFGMLCRNVVCMILSKAERSISVKVIAALTKHLLRDFSMEIAIGDVSYFQLLSSLATISVDNALLKLYATTKVSLSPVFAEMKHSQQVPQACILLNDPVLNIGQWSTPKDWDILSTAIQQNIAKFHDVNDISPFLCPILSYRKGNWSFFDFASLTSDHQLASRIVLRTRKIPDLFRPTDIVLIGGCNEDITSNKFSVRSSLESKDLVHFIKSTMAQCPFDEFSTSALHTILQFLESLTSTTAIWSLILIANDMATGAINILNSFLLVTIMKENFQSSGSDEALCSVLKFFAESSKSQPSNITLVQRVVQTVSLLPRIREAPLQSCLSILDKWVKTLLWKRLDAIGPMSLLHQMLSTLYSKSNGFLALPSVDNSVNPLKLLRLIISHQGLQQLLNTTTRNNDDVVEEESLSSSTRKVIKKSPAVLRLILFLVKLMSRWAFDEKLLQNTLQKVHKHLSLHFRGMFHESDRLLFRILSVLHADYNIGTAVYKLRPISATSSKDECWILDYIKPPLVYNTLAQFPCWRSLLPQTFAWEFDVVENKQSFNEQQMMFKGKMCMNARNAQEYHVEDVLASSDLLLEQSTLLRYDPAFLIPAILFALKNHYYSIRQLTNCGATSIVLVALASSCTIVRTYAVAALALIWKATNEQDAEREPNFRERPQLMQLLTFIRNSIDENNNRIVHNSKTNKDNNVINGKQALRSLSQTMPDGSTFRLPLTTAVFLAKSALQLMQPKHELFLFTNLYLIGRPMCDSRDVPLFDLLIQNADTDSEQSERLSVIRSIRDGLRTNQDHLNLCRKHAYSKLLMLFPLIASESRAGHAIFDILDLAASQRDSSRYLLEKCGISAWMEQMIVMPRERESATTTNEIGGQFVVRTLQLLRRLVSAIFLMDCENVVSGQQECFAALNMVISIVFDSLSWLVFKGDVLHEVILLLWDATIIQSQLLTKSQGILLDVGMLQRCISLLHHEYRQNVPSDILLSSLFILSTVRNCPLFALDAEQVNDILHSAISLIVGNEVVSADQQYFIAGLLSINHERPSAFELGTASLFHTLVQDNQLLPNAYSLSDRVDIGWALLQDQKYSTSDTLPSSIGLNQFCIQFTQWLVEQDNSLGNCSSNVLVWSLLVWNTCCGDALSVVASIAPSNNPFDIFDLEVDPNVLFRNKNQVECNRNANCFSLGLVKALVGMVNKVLPNIPLLSTSNTSLYSRIGLMSDTLSTLEINDQNAISVRTAFDSLMRLTSCIMSVSASPFQGDDLKSAMDIIECRLLQVETCTSSIAAKQNRHSAINVLCNKNTLSQLWAVFDNLPVSTTEPLLTNESHVPKPLDCAKGSQASATEYKMHKDNIDDQVWISNKRRKLWRPYGYRYAF